MASDVPSEVSIKLFVESRVAEMKVLDEMVHADREICHMMTLVPRYMRRRAASHNPRRIPQRDRINWHSSIPTGINVRKRPRRKYRKRAKVKLVEFTRRQRRVGWLETNVWHAKRCHMIERWGYKLPQKRTDKNQRPAYRASARQCLAQDISYYGCIEVCGSEEYLLNTLTKITNKETGPTFASERFLDGSAEGRTFLYEVDRYPQGAVAQVQFMWRAQFETNNKRKLWIWIHPAAFHQVLNLLREIFGLEECEPRFYEELIPAAPSHPNVLKATIRAEKYRDKLKRRSQQGDEDVPQKKPKPFKSNYILSSEDPSTCDRCVEYSDGRVTITSLKDNLQRFRLTGPGAHALLQEMLVPATVHVEDPSEIKAEDSKAYLDQSKTGLYWWQEYFSKDDSRTAHDAQLQVWKNWSEVQSPAELPARIALSLTVRDPRVVLPNKRLFMQAAARDIPQFLPVAAEPPSSSHLDCALWEAWVRRACKRSICHEAKINERRTKLVVPGSQLIERPDESRVPVLLIQSPGARTPWSPDAPEACPPGFGAGWDLVVPAGWGLQFWRAIEKHGAIIAGLDHDENMWRETLQARFPQGAPDTSAGRDDELHMWKEKLAAYQRRPPSKRPNYVKFGTVAPFHYPWRELVQEWVAGCFSTPQFASPIKQANVSVTEPPHSTSPTDYSEHPKRRSFDASSEKNTEKNPEKSEHSTEKKPKKSEDDSENYPEKSQSDDQAPILSGKEQDANNVESKEASEQAVSEADEGELSDSSKESQDKLSDSDVILESRNEDNSNSEPIPESKLKTNKSAKSDEDNQKGIEMEDKQEDGAINDSDGVIQDTYVELMEVTGTKDENCDSGDKHKFGDKKENSDVKPKQESGSKIANELSDVSSDESLLSDIASTEESTVSKAVVVQDSDVTKEETPVVPVPPIIDRSIDFYVLRSRYWLRRLQLLCTPAKSPNPEAKMTAWEELLKEVWSALPSLRNSLVPVSLVSYKRGKIEPNAMVCMPTGEDFVALSSKPNFSPEEPKHKDPLPYRNLKEARKAHKRKLKRKKKATNKQVSSDVDNVLSDSNSDSESDEKPKTTELLIRPDEITTDTQPKQVQDLLSSCSRLLMGYSISCGRLSLTKGRGQGYGLVSLCALLQLMCMQPCTDSPLVLVRSSDHLCYRFAVLKVLLPQL